jgi:hypothetical protein
MEKNIDKHEKNPIIYSTLIMMRHSTRIDYEIPNFVPIDYHYDPTLIYPHALNVINNIEFNINYPITKIITSPLLRSVQTARDFAIKYNLKDIYIDFRLIEMCSINYLYKKYEISKGIYQYNSDYIKKHVNDINIQFIQVRERVPLNYNNNNDLKDLYKECKELNQNILAITHFPNIIKFCNIFNKKIITEDIKPKYCAYVIVRNDEIIESNEIIKSNETTESNQKS